jgi:hypothetical protein
MSEFTNKIDRLIKRLHRDVTQCDLIEQRACVTEQRLLKLNESVQTLARLIDVSYVLLISSDKEKQIWFELVNDENLQLTNPDIEQFFYRLECYLKREMIDRNEKQAYIQALFHLNFF